MKFVTFKKDGIERAGLVWNESRVIDLNEAAQKQDKEKFPSTLLECIKLGDKFIDGVSQIMLKLQGKAKHTGYEINEVELLAPIPRPSKNIFCIGKNYAAHAIEMGSEADIPTNPIVFSKAPTTVIGPEKTVLHHNEITKCLDYEGELAVIIGKTGKSIKKEEVFDYIFGYTIINDITARDKQKRHKQYLLGKSLDTSCPMGPYIVHKSEIENPHCLQIETKINGEVRQSSNTEQFIFDIPTIISLISEGTTLEAGDIIATGTPSGVGDGFKPPRYLQPGDKMEITIEKIGTLKNKVQL